MINELYHIHKKNFLVIGDVMLDTYYWGNVNRISPEAPVPVFNKKDAKNTLGGAANVAINIAAANQNVSVMSIIGHDSGGEAIKSMLAEHQIAVNLLFPMERNTTIKTRFLASNNQQIMRMDVEDTREISHAESQFMLEKLNEQIQNFDLIVMSDYLKGMLSYEFTQKVIALAKEYRIPVIADVKDPQFNKYAGAYLLKPNLSELNALTRMPVNSKQEIVAAAEFLRKECGCCFVLTTCGAKGMLLVGDGINYLVNSTAKEVFDVTGAGDTTIAYLAVCMASQISIKNSVEISNCAAGIQVGKIGTSTVNLSELMETLSGKKRTAWHKLLDTTTISAFRQSFSEKKIVFTNGCFDILHVGHIRYLEKAAELGDILIIGLNSDASVRRLKGDGRPVNNENDRAELLCSLECVDYVTIFDEDTPYHLIQTVQPDVLVKGGDYQPDEVIGRDIVEARGGTLELIPLVKGKSTTSIINSIKN